MNSFIEMSAVQFAAKLTIVLAGAWLAHAALSRANPRWQVWLWRVTAVAVAALLIAAGLPPLYNVPLLQSSDDRLEVRAPVAITRKHPAHPARQMANRPLPPAIMTSVPAESASDRIDGAELSVQSSAAPKHVLHSTTGEAITSDMDAQVERLAAKNNPQQWLIVWQTWGLIPYGLVLSALLLRLAIGIFAARRAWAAATPAQGWAVAIAKQLACDSGRSVLPVRMTDRFESPVLVGVLRPKILLPKTMLQSLSAEQDLRGAIAHEVAHAAAHDPLWDCIIVVISALAWPHPLAWRARAAHRAACERVSDRMAADFVGDLPAYQRLLARIALRVSTATENVGLAMARRADIRTRLTALVGCPRAPRLGHIAGIIAACATITVTTLGVGALVVKPVQVHAAADEPSVAETSVDANAKSKVEPKPRKELGRSRPDALRFSVIRSDNDQPIANAKLTVRMYGDKPNINRELTTDTEGKATFEYPDGERPVYLWAMVHQSGLVPYYVSFGQNLIPAALPTEKTIRMNPGKKVGGKVVDPEGNPVEGAQLSILVPATDTPREIHYHLLYEKTAADGTWLLDGAPLNQPSLTISIEHPRFIKSSHLVQDRVDGKYPLDPGLKLTGRVTDSAGKPIAASHITVGRDRWGSLNKPVDVDENGSYIVYALRRQATWVTAEAPGFAPQVKQVELDPGLQPLDFELAPGNSTRFKVVNNAGEPVEGIRIVADTWKGFRSLWWEGKTNADGLADWTGAPEEAVEFHLLGAGYAALRDVVAVPQKEPHLVQLHRPLKIQGVVTDVRRVNIPEFRIGLGRKLSGRDKISWFAHESSTGRNGKFEIEYDEVCDEVFLRIEAAGFRPWISDAIRFDKSNHQISAQLESGSGPAGTVLSPDGQPAVGAQLTLVTANEGMQFTNGYRPLGGKQTVVSDRHGHFEFLPPDGPSLIIAVHDHGYSEMAVEEMTEAGDIQLQAWAKLEVTVRRGNTPLAGAKVAVHPEWRRDQIIRVFSYGITGTTDSTGHVTIDRVVPRTANVIKTIEQPIGSGSTVYPERSVTIPFAPGATERVTLGGTGIAIRGRFSVAGKPPAEHQWNLNDAVGITTSQEKADSDSRKYYRCLIDKDGSFRADDIPPGRYELSVNLTAAPDPNVCGHGANIGKIVREIELSGESPTVDLGLIEGSWFEQLGKGKQAPLFVAAGLDGKEVRMSELRGRLILIDFWATWCKPCMAEMPKLVALHDEFSADARFQILGLSVDSSLDEATAAAKKNSWPFMLAFAGPGTNSVVPARYEVKSIPVKFLVGADGTILYRGRDLDEIARLVRERLADLPARAPAAAGNSIGVQPVKIEESFRPGKPIALALASDNIEYRSNSKHSLNGPGLALWSNEGASIRKVEGIGTSGWLTGPQRLAIDPRRERLYYCDTLHHRLISLDRFGQQLFASDVPDLHAVAVDEGTGDLWCLAVNYLNSGELLILDLNGREKTRHPVAAFGIAYSPAEDVFWTVGSVIAKMSREGKILSSHPLPEGAYTFTDVAVDRERGGAWVLEIDHPDVPRSQRRLWKVASDGTATATHRFPKNALVRTLACVGTKPWLAVRTNYAEGSTNKEEWELQRFKLDGTLADALKIQASDMAVGVATGTIWVRTKESILRIDEEGNTLLTIPLPPDLQSVQILAF